MLWKYRKRVGEGGAEGHAAIPQHQALQRLHGDLYALSKRQLRRTEFELRWPAAQSAQWQLWQLTTPEDASFCLDLTCLLAYYAVDYSTNVERLAQLNDSVCKRRERPATVEACQELRCLPDYLGIVYRRQCDPALLLLLLELRMPSRGLRQAQWEAIAGLWDWHRIALLEVAAHSLPVQQTLLRALIHACLTVGEPTLWRAYYRHLQSATYLRDRQLTHTALRLIAGLRQAERRYELE